MKWNGSARTTTCVSSTQPRAAISATDIATAGTAALTVFSPSPGGGTRGARTLTTAPSPGAKADIGVFRPSTGTSYILLSSTGALQQTQWGATADIPVPSDYDGAGKADIAVYRPTTGTGIVSCAPVTAPSSSSSWGAVDDILVPRDDDGDGKADLAVYRPTTGTWYRIVRSSTGTVPQVQWGAAGDQPLS